MLTLNYCWFSLLFLDHLRGVSCEDLTPVKKEENSLENSTVTLSYRYSKQAAAGEEFYWYQLNPGKTPKFLISLTGAGELISEPVNRLSVRVNEDKTRMDLKISSAAVTDSAVYYCALRPTVTANTSTLDKNLQSKDNTILHYIH